MYVLQDDILSIKVNPKGAELVSLFHKNDKIEYLWNADPAFWGKHSPVLFPIVGALKDNCYYYNNKSYMLGRHGFARDRIFSLNGASSSELCLTLLSDERSLLQFPFKFRLDIIYQLQDNRLLVTYRVTNTGSAEMYFSIGGHPAFSVPFIKGTDYTDYYLEFEKTETADRWPISAEGLIETRSKPLLSNMQQLPLQRALFYQDALVFKDIRSERVSLRHKDSSKGISFIFKGFPYLGIWAAKDADFVCIEPWCGIADSVNTNQQLKSKEGINNLPVDGVFERKWECVVQN